MKVFISYSLSFFIILNTFSGNLFSLEWKRGIFQVDYINPNISIQKYGSLDPIKENADVPYKLSDLCSFSSQIKGSIFFRLSTGIMAQWVGPGSFSIDRFEHSWSEKVLNTENILTRNLIFLGQGRMIIDSKVIGKEALIIIETALGKIQCKEGIFSIDVEYLQDSKKKIITIICFKGTLQFDSINGSKFKLNPKDKIKALAKGEFFKVEPQIMTPSDSRFLDQYNRRRDQFENPNDYPQSEIEEANILKKVEEELSQSESVLRGEFFMPVLEPIQSFNANE